MTRGEKISATFFCTSIILIFYFGNKYQNEKKAIIEKNKYVTIAKVSEIKFGKSFTDARYYFFYDGIKYESGQYIHNSGAMYMNKYYRVDLSSVEPKYSKIHLDQEVTDSTEIANAGFKYESLQAEGSSKSAKK